MKRGLRLWPIFVLTMTVTMILSFSLTGLLTFLCFRQDLSSTDVSPFFIPFISFGLAACTASIAVIVIISRIFLHPIDQLIAALQKVTAGDFDIRLPEPPEGKDTLGVNRNFNKMVQALNSTETLQSDFIQNISHEFKTPLASIKGYALLLNASGLSGEQKTYADRILSGADRLSALTGNILRLSKLENQPIVIGKKCFSLDEQIRQAVLSMEPLWSRKNLSMNVELPDTEYYGNEELMFQIWTNLLSNAVKFTPENGSISVCLDRRPDRITVTVSDTGMGIRAEEIGHIFDRFYRGSQPEKSEGTGLGLALARRITELCGGSIRAESVPGCGSSFTVTLPPSP